MTYTRTKKKKREKNEILVNHEVIRVYAKNTDALMKKAAIFIIGIIIGVGGRSKVFIYS